jgi:phage terminase large subunit-like protein
MNQVLRFPAAKHDDGVDVLSVFGRGLEYIKAPKKKNDKAYKPTQFRGTNAWMG